MSESAGRAIGVGGVFFRSADPDGNRVELWEPPEKPPG